MFKDQYTDITDRQIKEPSKIEVPYCFFSAIMKLKDDK